MWKTGAAFLLMGGLVACTVLHHGGRAIPPPGGCDQCHRVPVSADWQAVLTSAEVPHPGERYPWQRPDAVGTTEATGPVHQNIEEACFQCHQSPDLAHADYHGRYHQRP